MITRRMKMRFLSSLLLVLLSFSVYAQDKKGDRKSENAQKVEARDKEKAQQKEAREKEKALKIEAREKENALKMQAREKENARKMEERANGNAQKIEVSADRRFMEQDFDKAMELYELALKEAKTASFSAPLHLKTARLYLTLLEYKAALPHFSAAIRTDKDLFTSVDICNYLDALRYSGEKTEAIKIAREYAYKDVYKQDQRYLNILHALTYEEGFLPVGTPEFRIEKSDHANTPFSEFWVGKMKDEYFYATSSSKFHDPSKKFYHRTRYFSLDKDSEYSISSSDLGDSRDSGNPRSRDSRGGGKKQLLHMIPIDLQNGPLSFSDDMTKMIVTEVDYNKGEQIEISSKGVNAFKTKLCFSEFNPRRNGWSAFKLAFPQKKDASYAHPFIFNNNRSVLFSSDMAGGFGGFDIYIVHWDDKTQRWGDPVNLGSQINTEGDEISPAVYDDMLIFSSNGHVGFGGYDIYGISYEDGKIINGSLTHFDYPINTVLNDFSMLRIDNDKGYIVSDRQPLSKDDVYYFERNTNLKKNNLIFGMSETQATNTGTITLANNEGDYNKPRHESLPRFHTQGEHLLSVYFDFDKSTLTPTALRDLKFWLLETDFSDVESLVIDGYADDMGTASYNYNLSKKRAETVARWLSDEGIKAHATVTGKGQLAVAENDSLPQVSYNNDSSTKNAYSMWNHRIWMNRMARKVDIKAIIK